MKIEQKNTFKRAYKKLHPKQRHIVNDAIQTIISNPLAGDSKKGDLADLRVYKFDCLQQQYLLAYQTADQWRLLVNLGPHENFYRDLKR
ncbi:MAG TPA: addiction module toxin RelE [Oceanospirillaceae bacterium]|nr:addiction module toxin RelE [Oceanospirillaceae bacterium]